jgi:DNA polymerase-3 subunit delta
MLYLLFGSDTYRRNERLSAIRDAYRARNPQALGTTTLEGSIPLEEMKAAMLAGGGLFEGKRLIIIRDAFAFHGKPFVSLLRELAIPKRDEVNVVLIEGDIAAREGFAELVALCRADRFDPLPPEKLRSWITSYVKRHGPEGGPKEIARDAAALLATLGSDLWRLRGELEKLIAYEMGKAMITEDAVRLLVRFPINETVFPLSDSVAERKPFEGLVALARLTAEGSGLDGLVEYTIRETRHLCKARAVLSAGASLDRAERFGIHSFVWQKRLAQARKLSDGEAEALLLRARDLDRARKTGAEKRLALERFILARGRETLRRR